MLMRSTLTTRLVASIIFSFVGVSYAAYVWPNPQYEALEAMLYEGTGVHGNLFAPFVADCVLRDNRNTTVAAEWVRLAYHDMATFNITSGTGGLDASIYYELDREENIGAGMTRTAGELSLNSNKYVSRADVIAMAAIWSVAACNGPLLPFRGGRQDSFEAGRKGVPEPQQELKDHVESFRLQGFNATEMIGLVACGHTLGGVREEDFPTIVPSNNDKSNPQLDTFDSTIQFDTSVATEYISGTTRNPLVVNSNQTVLSDLRIFSSDNNVTMKSLTDTATFSQTCSELLTRMLDTVPKGVVLTETIAPIPFKLSSQRFLFIDGKLAFSATFRIFEDLAGKSTPPKRTVQMLWCDRRGANANCADGSVNVAVAKANGGPSSGFIPGFVQRGSADSASTFSEGSPLTERLGMSLSFFTATVPTTFESSVGKFWFAVTEKGSTKATIYDNDGKGYLADTDELVYRFIGLKGGSDPSHFFNITVNQGEVPAYVGAGIHSSATAESVRIHAFDNTFLSNSASLDGSSPVRGISPEPIFNETITLQRNTSLPSLGGYDFYSAEVPATGRGTSFNLLTVDLEANLTDASTGAHRAVGLDFVFVLSPDREIIFSPPPLSAVSKTNLTLAGQGVLPSSAMRGLPRPFSDAACFYALSGLLLALLLM